MFEAAERFVNEAKSIVKIEISSFLTKIYKWNKIKNKISHEELTQIILEDSNYLKFLEEEVKFNSSVSTSVSKVTKDGGFVAEGNNKLV